MTIRKARRIRKKYKGKLIKDPKIMNRILEAVRVDILGGPMKIRMELDTSSWKGVYGSMEEDKIE